MKQITLSILLLFLTAAFSLAQDSTAVQRLLNPAERAERQALNLRRTLRTDSLNAREDARIVDAYKAAVRDLMKEGISAEQRRIRRQILREDKNRKLKKLQPS